MKIEEITISAFADYLKAFVSKALTKIFIDLEILVGKLHNLNIPKGILHKFVNCHSDQSYHVLIHDKNIYSSHQWFCRHQGPYYNLGT